MFNIGEPADGIYTFNLKCPKIQNVNPTYTVTYRSDCDQLRRSGLSPVPKDIKADPDSVAGVPTEKLGLQITGVAVAEGTQKVPARLVRDNDGVPTAVIWKLTDVFLSMANNIKVASDDDIVVCSLQGAGVNQNVNFEDIDKEIKLNGLNINNNKIGTIVYSCTKTPATGTPMTESIGVRLKLDTQSDPAGLKIVDAIEINPLQAAGQYSIKFKIQGFGGLRLKAEFVPASGGPIDLGEITLKSVQAPVKYSTESFDSFTASKTYYELTESAHPTLKGKIRVTAIDNPALKAEKDVQFTLSAKSAAQTGGWKIDGRPPAGGGASAGVSPPSLIKQIVVTTQDDRITELDINNLPLNKNLIVWARIDPTNFQKAEFDFGEGTYLESKRELVQYPADSLDRWASGEMKFTSAGPTTLKVKITFTDGKTEESALVVTSK